jgi:hypothetical protein
VAVSKRKVVQGHAQMMEEWLQHPRVTSTNYCLADQRHLAGTLQLGAINGIASKLLNNFFVLCYQKSCDDNIAVLLPS